MSVLIYNGVCLPYPITTQFDQKVVYDESNTDWMCTKFDIQVQSILNVNYLDVIYPSYAADGNPDDAASIMNAIRTLLLRPRRTLSFKVNDVEMIPDRTDGSGTVDVRNGPRPLSCQIKQLTDVTFLISYHIEAHYWENVEITVPGLEPLNRRGCPIISNRWSETVEYDNRMVATKTREGKYIMRSDNADARIVDQYRSRMAVVGVAPGFLRKSSKYKVDPSGLAIEYQVVDKEYFKVPPEPAFEAKGYYTETSIKQGGAQRLGEAYVRLVGNNDKNTQGKLLNVAITVVMKKLSVRAIPDGPRVRGSLRTQIIFASLKVDLYENVVEVRAVARFTQAGNKRMYGGVAGFAGLGSMVYTPLTEAGAPPPTYKDRGTSSILLQAARYYDPSFVTTELSGVDSFQSGDNPDTGVRINLNHGYRVGDLGVNRET